uniref:U2A'/phosphoprotein 32 family A C-terminal domain-containing protein n=1 Tax=Esox lucius TaxID=8010 RepID=A0A3P8XSN2_ESOLU
LSPSSSGVNTSSGSFPKSHSSQYSDLSLTHTPLSVDQSPDSGILPSSRFRFVSWQRLEESNVRGDQLSCPRVREGPSEDELFLRGEDDTHWERGRGRGRGRRRDEEGQKWEERLQENWENCVELNLSFQDLGDPFQQENFHRILKRLIRVERLQLINNSLTDLSSVRLPRCRSLNLHSNHLTCVRQLPKLPAVEHLCLSENSIATLVGLGALQTSPLQSLTLTRNPVTYITDYRTRWGEGGLGQGHVYHCVASPLLFITDCKRLGTEETSCSSL